MSLKRSGALFWFLAALLAIHKISSHTSLVKAYVAAEERNTTLGRYRRITTSHPWRNRQKLLPSSSTLGRHRWTWSTSRATDGPSELLNTTTTPSSTTLSVIESLSSTSDQNAGRRIDIFDSSSSENNPRSVVWPIRLRPPAQKRFRAPTPTTSAPQVLLKLLQPKPTRPAIYSLDGFVPKPSIKKITTEPPYVMIRNDLQQLPSVAKRRKINKFSKTDEESEDDDEDDYIGNNGRKKKKPAVSHYTAFARKGVPGQDFPVFGFIPQTEFQCGSQPGPGMYADPFTGCQVWHMCPGGNLAPRHSFLCPNGTIFNQKKRICDWWYNVDCNMKKSRNTRSLTLIDEIFSDIYMD